MAETDPSTESTPPAGGLELVRRFVNSLDIEAGTDELTDPDGWPAWAGRNGFRQQPSSSSDDLARLVRLREALREGLQANHDRAPLPEAVATELTRAAQWAEVRVRFCPDGAMLGSEADGARAVGAQVLARVAAGLADGTWARLKVCRNDACRWAFFDTSRSRTGQWCSMGVCGNRAKQARHRSRRTAEPNL
ncbi:CGNR zinc finger domain-containing protein [Kineosporia rhizophila]|uniref:CGNR zinc finger domain-containing protein n=1 Tax=Kineosporia TaxID=49184 RepID=UPI001E53F0FE|nr:CGNR zinc finger domain-containing protein [Kineosporia sp. NBRC 101677]MCE0534543.1 CGNR zinc finger domain-containing protein [Kineosporia rhizophila]